jgi:hypothetical protein
MFTDVRTGSIVVAQHLGTVLAALVLLCIHVGLGARSRRLLAAANDGDGSDAMHAAAWRWPVDAALGASLLALVLLASGAVGALQPVTVLLITGALGAFVWRDVLAAARELPQLVTRGRLPFIALLLLLLAAAVAPPTEWDSVMYHVRIPLWLLEQGRLAVPPDSLHVSLIGAAHFSSLPLLALGLRSGPAVMQVIAFALVLAGTFALARAALASRAAAWFAVVALIGTPVFVLVAVTARVDVTLVLALVAAHVALATARSRVALGRSSGELVAVTALLLGGAVAIKPQAGAYAIALLPLAWPVLRSLPSVRPALIASALGLAVSVPWLLKNALLVGAPFAPIGAGDRLEPWLATIFGSAVVPAGTDTSILRALSESRAVFDVLAAFFDPGSLTIEGEGAFYALAPVLLLVPAVLLTANARARALGPLLVGLVYAALVIVPFQQINLRYLMPAVPALVVALAAGLDAIVSDRFGTLKVRERRILASILVLAALYPVGGALRHRFFAGSAVLLRHAAGQASAQEVWRRHPDGTVRSYAPVIGNLHRLVPVDGKVLMLWEARGLPIERKTLVDVRLSNWSFLAQSSAPAACLAGTGITHVMVGTGSVEFYVSRGAKAEAFHLNDFTAFRDRCLTDYVNIGPGFGLFTMRPPAP